MKKITFLFIVLLSVNAQIENVPLDHNVYTFLKEMEVKKIIYGIDEDIPNLRFGEVKEFLKQIEAKQSQLSNTERRLLKKYQIEFFPEMMNSDNTWDMFGASPNLFTSPFTIFDDRQKFLYRYQDGDNNLHRNQNRR